MEIIFIIIAFAIALFLVEKINRLEKDNICHKSIEDIQGERPTESKERLLRFPPVRAVEKAK